MKVLSPQAEMEAKGDESELHVIILDEVTLHPKPYTLHPQP